jgi:DNA-binding CsgD family transcriptional regulator
MKGVEIMKPRSILLGGIYFTPLEIKILGLVAQGFSNKDIARLLPKADGSEYSLYTINHYLESIYQKIHVKNRTEATNWLREHDSSRNVSTSQIQNVSGQEIDLSLIPNLSLLVPYREQDEQVEQAIRYAVRAQNIRCLKDDALGAIGWYQRALMTLGQNVPLLQICIYRNLGSAFNEIGDSQSSKLKLTVARKVALAEQNVVKKKGDLETVRLTECFLLRIEVDFLWLGTDMNNWKKILAEAPRLLERFWTYEDYIGIINLHLLTVRAQMCMNKWLDAEKTIEKALDTAYTLDESLCAQHTFFLDYPLPKGHLWLPEELLRIKTGIHISLRKHYISALKQ